MWEWVAEPDACEFCTRMDGTVHEDDESIDQLSHPNCRCTQIPYVSQKEINRLEPVDQDLLIERTLAKLREDIQDLPPFKYEPGTVQYKAYKIMQKVENRRRYVTYVYSDAKTLEEFWMFRKANGLTYEEGFLSKEAPKRIQEIRQLIKEFGLEKVYYSADLHPMTRKALLARSEGKSLEQFKKEVQIAKRKGKVRDRKTDETKEDRPDLRRNPFNPNDEKDEDFWDW